MRRGEKNRVHDVSVVHHEKSVYTFCTASPSQAVPGESTNPPPCLYGWCVCVV